MKFYVSKTGNKLNGLPYCPEHIAECICVNPLYPVKFVDDHVFHFNNKVIIDSGAFQDVKDSQRLSFMEALQRQFDFQKNCNISADAIVSYDRLVDEQIHEGKQFKKRVSEEVGKRYVEETIQAAEFLSEYIKKHSINKDLILSCQGTTLEQYQYCIERVSNMARKRDIIGLGGFCIISRSKEYEEQFYKVIEWAFPYLHSKGLTKVHIFGVGIFKILIRAEILAIKYGINLSYDTSSAEISGVMGRVFDPSSLTMTHIFEKYEKNIEYKPRNLAYINIKSINDFWENFDDMCGIVPYKIEGW